MNLVPLRMPKATNTYETRNEYGSYYLTANGDNYTLPNRPSSVAAAPLPLYRYVIPPISEYEGQATSITTSEAWNEYYL